MRLRRLAELAILAVALLCDHSIAAPVRADNAEAELIARDQALSPGRPAVIGLRLKHDPQWHTYWINPGDSGMPTTIQWKLPPGTRTGPIQWPAPKRIPLSGGLIHA